MKKVLLSAGLLSAVAAGAQTVTAANALTSGTGNLYYVLDSGAVTLDAVIGTGVTWNYSSLLGETDGNPLLNEDTVINAADSPHAANYPMATYNDVMDAGASQFFSNNPDSTTIWGFVFNVDTYEVIIKHNANPLIGLKYPMNVGDSYADITLGEVEIAGNTGTTDGTANVTVDGYGTLNACGYTHTNVTRVKLVENISTEITVIPFGTITGTVTRTIYSYYDFANDEMPIFVHATIGVSSTLFNGGYTAVYYINEPGYAGVNEVKETNFSVYPNPSNNVVTITTDGTADNFQVINALGEVVLTVTAPQPTEQVNVAGFEAGVYFVNVRKGEAVTTQKLIVE